MSNKTRLQTNNENLQALIGKANALPNAGGGDNPEAPSVDMCQIDFLYEGMSLDLDFLARAQKYKIVYTDEVNQVQVTTMENFTVTLDTWGYGLVGSIVARAGTLVYFQYGGASVEGDCISIYDNNHTTLLAIVPTSDCIIHG